MREAASISRCDARFVFVPVRERLFLVTFFTLEILRFQRELFTTQQGGDTLGVRMLLALLAMALFHIVRGFGVSGDDAFEVTENHLIGTLGDDIVGHHRCLSAAAGGIDHESGHGVAGGVAAEVLDNLNTFGYGRTEVFEAH